MSRVLGTAMVGVMALTSCAQLVQYTDEISDTDTGRTLLVTTPATVGGLAGFVVGIPADIAFLPITYSVYAVRSSGPEPIDQSSTLLFPSFLLWRAGKLLAVPLDLFEYLVYRAWRAPETLTTQERNQIESYHDELAFPSYPSTPIYPTERKPIWNEDTKPFMPFGIELGEKRRDIGR